MSTEPVFYKTIRNQSWDYKTKKEYEEVLLRQQPYIHIHYQPIYDERNFDIFDPRYTRLKSADWKSFRDPKKFWDTTVNKSKKLADEVKAGFSYAAELGAVKDLPPQWADAMRELYTPLRHLEYGESIQMQHVIRYTFGTMIEQCATFQAFDKTGRVQWISQWAMNMQECHGDILAQGKQVLLNEPAYQPLRHYVEEILVTMDWAEVIVAENLTLDLLLGNLMYRELNKEAARRGDTQLTILNLVIAKQLDWQRDWAFSLLGFLAKDKAESSMDYLKARGYEDWQGDYRWGRILGDPRRTPGVPLKNVEIIQEWVEKWYPKAFESVLALAPLFEKHGIRIDVFATLKKIEEEHVMPAYQKYQLPFRPYSPRKENE